MSGLDLRAAVAARDVDALAREVERLRTVVEAQKVGGGIRMALRRSRNDRRHLRHQARHLQARIDRVERLLATHEADLEGLWEARLWFHREPTSDEWDRLRDAAFDIVRDPDGGCPVSGGSLVPCGTTLPVAHVRRALATQETPA